MSPEEDYKRSFLDNGIRTTKKERKLTWLCAETGKDKKHWKSLTSRQLGKIIYNNYKNERNN